MDHIRADRSGNGDGGSSLAAKQSVVAFDPNIMKYIRRRKSMIIELLIILVLAAGIGWAVYKSINKAKKGGGCCPEHEETVKRSVVSDRNKSHYPYTVILNIGGMTCENCARRVENALNGLEGIWANVDIASHKATVRCKMPPDSDTLSKAVIEAGYVVTGVGD